MPSPSVHRFEVDLGPGYAGGLDPLAPQDPGLFLEERTFPFRRFLESRIEGGVYDRQLSRRLGLVPGDDPDANSPLYLNFRLGDQKLSYIEEAVLGRLSSLDHDESPARIVYRRDGAPHGDLGAQPVPELGRTLDKYPRPSRSFHESA